VTFRLATEAIDDLDAITLSLAEHSGWDRSMTVEQQLWSAFEDIGQTPGIGHLRPDLTPLNLYFHFSDPYMIAFRRDLLPIPIVAIIHGSRDIAEIIANRSL
jgi:plasmid stabilization system protein ParE